MIFTYVYYVVDKVSETIIGSFFAKSEAMASKMMKGFDFKKANLDPDDVEVYRDPLKVRSYETYSEVMKDLGVKANLFNFHQELFDFEEVKK